MLNQLLADYGALRQKLDKRFGAMPELSLCRVTVALVELGDSQAVEREVERLERDSVGWLRRQSLVVRTPRKDRASNGGLPLVGEWAVSPTESSHLRPNGKGGWTMFVYREHDDESSGASTCLKEEATLLGQDGERNRYFVYWGVEQDAKGFPSQRSVRRLFARFAGFDDGKRSP